MRLFLAAVLAVLPCGAGLAAPPPVSSYATLANALATSTVITDFVNDSVIGLYTSGETFQITRNTVIDAGTNNVVLDGNNLTRLFYVHTNCELTLANLQLTNGFSAEGGAIYNQGTLVISNCIFSGNTVSSPAGLSGADGTTNSPSGADGASGVSVWGGAIYSQGPLFVYNSVFSANGAKAGPGGNGGAGLTTSGFSYAGYGGNGGNGGIAYGAAICSTGTNNVLFATEFLGNFSIAGDGGTGGASGTNIQYPMYDAGSGVGGDGGYALGGAVFVGGVLSISNCLFASNSAAGGNSAAADWVYNGTGYNAYSGGEAGGGGLFISTAASTAYLENTIFWENFCVAGSGGAAFATASIAGNGGAALGGGLETEATIAELRNCTFATNLLAAGAFGIDSGTNGENGENGVAEGWDIYRGAGVTRIANSILSGQLDNATGVTDGGYNISSDTTLTKLYPTTLLKTNPVLDSGLSAQGGPTLGPVGITGPPMLTLALLEGSPATNFIPGIPGLSFPATDERLFPRGSPASAGAFETFADIIATTNTPPPTITLQPQNQSVILGETAFLTVAATPNPDDPNPLGYQWQLNGTNLLESSSFSGVNTPNLIISHVAAPDLGAYQAIVSPSLLDSVTNSATAYLLVNIPTLIKTQPASHLNVPIGSVINLSVVVTGSPPFFYQWRTNGVPLVDGNEFTGSSTTNLTISPVALGDAANYTVVVTNFFANRSVTSAVARLSVVLDKTRPTIAIGYPTAGLRTTNSLITGTARDNAQVTQVLCWVTNIFGGATNRFMTNAVLTFTNGVTVGSWALSNIFLPGTNIVGVQSVDYSTNYSLPAKCEFFYVVPSPFSLGYNNHNYGNVIGAASVAGTAPPTNGAMLNIGESYTLTATQGVGYLFSNWISSGFISYSNPLHFTMSSNLAIQANFIATPFTNVAVNYNGLFFQTNEIGVTVPTAGMLKGLKFNSLGAYSGSLIQAGTSHAISGEFNVFGHASNYIARTTALGGPLGLAMDVGFSNGEITGTVTGLKSNWQASLLAEESTTSAASSEATMLLQPGTNGLGEYPPGYGYIFMTNAKGNLSLTGELPDGAAFSQLSVPLGNFGDVPIYESLNGNAGLIFGWVTVSNGLPEASNGLTWIQPPSKTTFYPAGLTNLLAVEGSTWTRLPEFSATGNLTISNASLDLEYPVVITNGTIANATNSTLLNGTVNAKTGLVTISFRSGLKSIPLSGTGALLQTVTNIGGNFVTKTNAGIISFQ